MASPGLLRERKVVCTRKIDARLPGKGNPNSHGARPVYLIIIMIKWSRTSRLSILSGWEGRREAERQGGREEGMEG